MKKIMFIVSIVVSIVHIVLPMQKPRTGRVVNRQNLLSLRKAKSSPDFFFTQDRSKEKFQKESDLWKKHFEKLRVKEEDHASMIAYLDKKETRERSVDSLGLDADVMQWLRELEEKNPMAFTAYIYREVRSREPKKSPL